MLTHTSWAPRRAASYERLEFLGDAVLDVLVSEELMRRHPSVDEGDLSWMRQSVVGRAACARVAREAGLPDAMVQAAPAGRREAAAEIAGRPGVQAALAEAAIGAGWLDRGPDATREDVLAAFGALLDAAVPGVRDSKTALQEAAARRRLEVAYILVSSEGPPQQPTFTSRVTVGGSVLGEGSGPSKQASEQAAATIALAAVDGD